jgi:sugar/nucleoside kinase (ribokinase family)
VSVTVVGSVAFDALQTPFGERERVLGGAATHFSLAASFFTDVHVVGVVGEDFGEAEFDVFHRHGVDTSDIERVEGGKSFFWSGRYDWDFDTAQTLDTQLNVFADFDPKLSRDSRSSDVLFLANIQPDLQRRVREQCTRARFVGLDSMNYWIDTVRDSLLQTVAGVDAVLLNDAEIRMLTREPNLALGTRALRELGPRVVVAKQGKYGAALFTEEGFFALPSYPLETVIDPTGAGDSFAGGFLGFLAAHAGDEITDDVVRCAMAYGSVLASFNVEDFGTERVQRLTHDEIGERFSEFKRMTHFDEMPIPALHAADSLSA